MGGGRVNETLLKKTFSSKAYFFKNLFFILKGKKYVTTYSQPNFAIASLVTYSEIRQNSSLYSSACLTPSNLVHDVSIFVDKAQTTGQSAAGH